jgi:hypothetical protein
MSAYEEPAARNNRFDGWADPFLPKVPDPGNGKRQPERLLDESCSLGITAQRRPVCVDQRTAEQARQPTPSETKHISPAQLFAPTNKRLTHLPLLFAS